MFIIQVCNTCSFLIRLRFPKSKSISDILRKRFGQSTLKKTQKFDKLDYRPDKAKLDLEFLSRCKNFILNFLNLHISPSALPRFELNLIESVTSCMVSVSEKTAQ